MADDRETPSQEENLRKDLDSKIRSMRVAIKWLIEAKRFKLEFGGDAWNGSGDKGLAEIANTTYDEAIVELNLARRNLENSRERYRKFWSK
jgi:hypothetical protein